MLKEKIAGGRQRLRADILRWRHCQPKLPCPLRLLSIAAPGRRRAIRIAALLLAGPRPVVRPGAVAPERRAVAVDIDRGAVFAGPAFPIDASKSPEPPEPAPTPAPAPSVVMPAVPGIPPPPEGSDAGTAARRSRLLVPRQIRGWPTRALDQFSNAAVVARVVN
jgi:hypothetical protein